MQTAAFFSTIIALAASASALAVRADNAPFLLASNPDSTSNAVWVQYDPSSASTGQALFFSDKSVGTFEGYIANGAKSGMVQNKASPGQVLLLDGANQLKIGEQMTLSDVNYQYWNIEQVSGESSEYKLVWSSGTDASGSQLKWYQCSGSDSSESEIYYSSGTPSGKTCGAGFDMIVDYQQ